jgi:hypothetical protein
MLLAKQGVNVNQAADDGATPLFMASQKGHAEVVSMLLAKQGVNVNQAANSGATPLYVASQNGHAEVVSTLLVKQGVNVNQAKNNSATPLYVASQKGYTKVVSMLLITKDIDVNKAWKKNENELVTPLRAAIDYSHTEIAKLLVIRGSILVDAPTGAHGIQLNLVLGAFARACKADFDALCVFRLCLVRAHHDDPPVVEGAPSPAQRRRISRHRMGRKGSFAVPRIESFLVPCLPDTFLPDRAARDTLNIVLNITAAAHGNHGSSSTETPAEP